MWIQGHESRRCKPNHHWSMLLILKVLLNFLWFTAPYLWSCLTGLPSAVLHYHVLANAADACLVASKRSADRSSKWISTPSTHRSLTKNLREKCFFQIRQLAIEKMRVRACAFVTSLYLWVPRATSWSGPLAFFSQLLSPWAPLHEGRLRTKTGRPAFRHSRSVLNWTPSIAGNRRKTFPTFLIPGCRSNHKTGSAMAVPSAHLQVIWTLEVQHEDPAASKYVWFPFADATVHVGIW